MYALIAQRSIDTILYWRPTKHSLSNVNSTTFYDDNHPRNTSSPILSPGLVGIPVSIALHHRRAILVTDAHGQFAGHEDRQEANRTGCRSRYRRYIMWPMWSLVPGEDSSTGNVTGGRKLARYVLTLRVRER